MRRGIAALAAAVFAVTGCSTQLEHGTVTGKEHHPAWSQTTCVMRTKQGCASWHTQWYPERWTLDLKNGSTEGYAEVDLPTFNRYRVGDTYP